MKRQIRLIHKLVLLVILTAGFSVLVPSLLVLRSGTLAIEGQIKDLAESEARRGGLLVELAVQARIQQLGELAQSLAEESAARTPAGREAVLRRWFERNLDALEVGYEGTAATTPWVASRDGLLRPDQKIATLVLPADWASYRGLEIGHEHQPDRAADRLVMRLPPTSDQPFTLTSEWAIASYSDLLRNFPVGRHGYLMLVDRNGDLLGHPLSFRPDLPPQTQALFLPGRDLSHLPLVSDLAPGSHAVGVDRRTARLHYNNETGQPVVAGAATIAGLLWTVIAEQPEREAMAAVDGMKWQVMLWGSTTGLMAVLLGLAIVGQITKPLETLAEAANRVGAGDLTHPVGVATSDEIGQLSLSFNEMQIRLREMYDKLERMVAERTRELQETTDFLNSVLDSSTEYSIIATDLRGAILSYNEGSRRIYGYDPEEILGAPVTILIPPEEQQAMRDVYAQARRDGSFGGQGLRIRKGGRRLPVRYFLSLRYDDAGQPVGYTSISRDITEQRQMEAKIREYTENLENLVAVKTRELKETNEQLARANRLKAEFLASMSHELRTPLNAVIGFADVLREEVAGPLNPDQKQFANDIRESGRQLLNLINNILDLSKVDAGRMTLQAEEIEMSGIFDEVQTIVQGMALRKNLALSFHESPAGLRLTADRVKMLQILYNLLSNAVKFTPAGGAVRVEAERHENETEIRVVDTGVGIARENLELIFEEFRQVDSRLSREYGGTGLGLALTRKLVFLHGGQLKVKSEPDQGSTFSFTIPHRLPIHQDSVAPTGPKV